MGRFVEANVSGASLLGLDRGTATNKHFGEFVAAEGRLVFSKFCRQVLQTQAKQQCEVNLQIGDQRVPVAVEVNGCPGRPRKSNFLPCGGCGHF